jgi:lysophospholipase L1-like esterase
MGKKLYGFHPYPSGDDDSIIQADLTSSTAIDGADTQGGGQDFTADGMDVGVNKALLWASPTNYDRLDVGFYMRFEIETAFLDKDRLPAAIEYILSFAAGWLLLKKTDGDLASAAVGNQNAGISISTVLKPAMSEVVLNHFGTHTDIYVDKGHVHRRIADTPQSQDPTRFQNLYLGGDRTNANKGTNGYRIKNFEVLTRPQLFIPRFNTSNVLFIGDSITVNGNIPSEMGMNDNVSNQYTYLPHRTGRGYNAPTGTGEGALGVYFDNGYHNIFFREMARRGYHFASCYNEAAAGGTTEQIEVRLDDWIAKGSKADIALVFAGTNDVATDTLRDLTDTEEPALKSIIDKLHANGTKRVVLCTVPTVKFHRTPVDYDVPNAVANVANWKAIVEDIPAYAVTSGYGANFVTIADVFNALDGESALITYFEDNQIHPSETGNILFAREIARACLVAVSTI